MICIKGNQLLVGDILLGVPGCSTTMKVVKIEPYRGILNFLCGMAFVEGIVEGVRTRLKIPLEEAKLYNVSREKVVEPCELEVGMQVEYAPGKLGIVCKVEVYRGILDFLYGVATLKLYDTEGKFAGHCKLPLEKEGRYRVCY